MEKKLMSVPELCAYLAMPRATVYGYVARERFPAGCVVRLGRALKFDKKEIDAWVTAQQTKTRD